MIRSSSARSSSSKVMVMRCMYPYPSSAAAVAEPSESIGEIQSRRQRFQGVELEIADPGGAEFGDLGSADVGRVEELRGVGLLVEQVEDRELKFQLVGEIVADIGIGLGIASPARGVRAVGQRL